MKIVYTGEVRETGIHIFNRKAFDKECEGLMGKKVEITVQKKKKSRSVMQNAYYWGVVVPVVRNGLLDVGYMMSIEETHGLLKAKFRQVEIVNVNTGEIIKSVGSTTDMTTLDFMDYIAEIQQWGAEYLNIHIPDPNEQIEFKYK